MTAALRTPVARVDTAALAHNLGRARAAAPGSAVFAVVKAQGYGHGLERAAHALAPGCAGFGVACTGEGIALRQAGFDDHRVCVLNGPADADELAACARWALEPVIHQRWQLGALEELPGAGVVRPWVKLDSGMGRIGVPAADARGWHEAVSSCRSVAGPAGLMTHMASADARGDDYTRRQWRTLERATRGLAGERSAANSACVLGWPATHGDWVRPGIMLYGCSPFVEGAREDLGLRPAMTLRTRLIAVNQLEAGAAVGYGRTYHCPEDMPVGVAAIGYGDGYPRHAPNGTPVLVNGRRAPLAGRVSMDKITLDLRGQPDAAVGDAVTLWGEGLPVEEIAEAAGTIGYELLAGIHGRMRVEAVR